MTACAPQTKIVPPKRGLCPEKINRHGATGVQMEAKNSQISVYRRNFCGLTPSFLILLVRRPFFSFWSSPKNSRKFARILRRKQEFVEIFLREIFFLGLYLVRLIHTRINFSCLFRIHTLKLLVPLQNLFLPPQSRYPGARPDLTSPYLDQITYN